MIIIICLIVVIVGATIAIVRSKKPLNHIIAEAKYELFYNVMGSRALLEDIVMKGKNKTELTAKSGRIAVITGGGRGIGAEVVKMLMQCDIHVVMGCRNIDAGEKLLRAFREAGIETGQLDVYKLDISSIKSVKEFAGVIKDKYPKVHYLINNAGIMFGPYIETIDGYESQFATNYLGHFLLTHLLLQNIKDAGTVDCNARVVNVSSCAHIVGTIDFDDINCRNLYIPAAAYAQSKLAQILFTVYLEKMFIKEKANVQVHSVHPGIVNTELFNGTPVKTIAPWVPHLFFKTPEKGAVPIIHACLSPQLEKLGGTYIHNCKIYQTGENVKSEELQEKLFKFTTELLGIEQFGKA